MYFPFFGEANLADGGSSQWNGNLLAAARGSVMCSTAMFNCSQMRLTIKGQV